MYHHHNGKIGFYHTIGLHFQAQISKQNKNKHLVHLCNTCTSPCFTPLKKGSSTEKLLLAIHCAPNLLLAILCGNELQQFSPVKEVQD